MSTHRWTSSTRLKRHDTGEQIQPGDAFEPTESELRAFGDHIEPIEEAESGSEPAAAEEGDNSDDAEDADEKESADEPESASDEDGDVSFDADAWFDDHDGFEERIETIESGHADDLLDEIEEAERSQNVIQAVQERRDELEE